MFKNVTRKETDIGIKKEKGKHKPFRSSLVKMAPKEILRKFPVFSKNWKFPISSPVVNESWIR